MHYSAEIAEDRDGLASGSRFFRLFEATAAALLKIGAATFAGAALAFSLIDMVPQRYDAETTLKVEGASPAAIARASEAIRSERSLDNLARALNLDAGGEFADDRPDVVRLVSEIVTGAQVSVSAAEDGLRDRLLQAIDTRYDPDTGLFSISVNASRAASAAGIANFLGTSFSDELSVAGSTPLEEKLRQTFERAQAALSGFRAATGEAKLAELRRSQAQAEQRAAMIAELEAQLAEQKQRMAQAQAMTPADVLNEPLPDSLDYTGIAYQRQRYVEAKLAVGQLAGDLGPRHPRLMAAEAALADARSDIDTGLKELVASLTEQQASTARQLADLKAENDAAKPQDDELAATAARLAMLEATASEAQENYLQALRSAETTVGIAAVTVKTLVPASAENATAVGFSAAEILAGGAAMGFGLGVVLAFATRRRPLVDVEDDELPEMEADEPPLEAEPVTIGTAAMLFENPPRQQDWPVANDDENRLFADELLADELVWEPDLEPLRQEEHQDDYEPDFQPDDEVDHHDWSRYPLPANDSSFDEERPLVEQIRQALNAGRRPIAEVELPPLVAAAAAGHASVEVLELQRDVAQLRELFEEYSASVRAG